MDTDGLTLVSYTYQWLRGDPGTSNHANISGASGFQYLVGANDVGKELSVRVNFTDDLGNPETTYKRSDRDCDSRARGDGSPDHPECG